MAGSYHGDCRSNTATGGKAPVKLLLTCCNKSENSALEDPQVFLYSLDCQTQTVSPVPLSLDRDEHGFTGLCAYAGGWLISPQNNIRRALAQHPMRVLQLDRELRLINTFAVAEAVDSHSMLVREGECFIASTGNDCVIALDLNTGECREHWRYTRSGDDVLHVNSLAYYRDQLWISHFGARPGEDKASARAGMIESTVTGEILYPGIQHPHSLTCSDGQLWWCESGAGRVWCDGELQVRVQQGYLRGLAVQGDRLAVGVSRQRVRSRSSDSEYQPAPEKIGESGVYLYERTVDSGWQLSDFVSLAAVTDEVYDLALLAG